MRNDKVINKYHEFEDKLIYQFNNHEFYAKIFPKFSKDDFIKYILQLGHISFEFVKFIERAKLPLKSEIGKETIRKILRDEIPAKGPTHQDNRFSDLIRIGLSPNQILNTLPTKETLKVLGQYYDAINYPQEYYDIKIIMFLRVIGEVLVGETYKHVVTGLKKHFNLLKNANYRIYEFSDNFKFDKEIINETQFLSESPGTIYAG